MLEIDEDHAPVTDSSLHSWTRDGQLDMEDVNLNVSHGVCWSRGHNICSGPAAGVDGGSGEAGPLVWPGAAPAGGGPSGSPGPSDDGSREAAAARVPSPAPHPPLVLKPSPPHTGARLPRAPPTPSALDRPAPRVSATPLAPDRPPPHRLRQQSCLEVGPTSAAAGPAPRDLEFGAAGGGPPDPPTPTAAGAQDAGSSAAAAAAAVAAPGPQLQPAGPLAQGGRAPATAWPASLVGAGRRGPLALTPAAPTPTQRPTAVAAPGPLLQRVGLPAQGGRAPATARPTPAPTPTPSPTASGGWDKPAGVQTHVGAGRAAGQPLPSAGL